MQVKNIILNIKSIYRELAKINSLRKNQEAKKFENSSEIFFETI